MTDRVLWAAQAELLYFGMVSQGAARGVAPL